MNRRGRAPAVTLGLAISSTAAAVVVALAFVAASGRAAPEVAVAGAPPGAGAAAPGARAPEHAPVAAANDLFQGFVVAAHATDLLAPEFIFRVLGWNSDWGQRKLLELAPDGKPVKKGDVVARFEFGADDALRHINERVARAQSDEAQSRIDASQALEALEMDHRRKQIDARLAALSLERERALSRRQADSLRINHKLAEFDVDAAGQRLASARVARATEREHKTKSLARANEGLERFQYFKGRFQITAPHDGVVRHAFNPRERRKLQKGDNTQAGMKVVSLAQDDLLAVRFFVPEAQAAHIAVGTKLAVVVPTSAEELSAVVESVDFFPQEIGFLLENDGLPNGREKAIQVRAALTSQPAGLASGTEVRVKVRP